MLMGMETIHGSRRPICLICSMLILDQRDFQGLRVTKNVRKWGDTVPDDMFLAPERSRLPPIGKACQNGLFPLAMLCSCKDVNKEMLPIVYGKDPLRF